MWVTASCVTLAAAAAPVVAVLHAKRRLRRAEERLAEGLGELPCSPFDAAAFHAAAQKLAVADWPPSRALRARYEALSARTASDLAFSGAVARVACGDRAKLLGARAAATCAAAAAARGALERGGASLEAAARFAADEAVALEALDLRARCERTLPPAWELPWRADWQREEAARDARALADLARARFSHDALETAPIATCCAELAFVANAAEALLERREEPLAAPARAVLAKTLDRARRAERALRGSRDFWDERRTEDELQQLRKATAAAERAAGEQARARVAAEARVALAAECRDAIGRLEASLRAAAAPPIAPPVAHAVCRNDVDPISLEPLASYDAKDLRLLPSGNCAHADLLKKMLRRVDPFTNLPLPSDKSAGAGADALMAAATRACRE